jgi:hypothetical protein
MNTNIRKAIQFETITPISIGAGSDYDWIYGMDYIINDQKIYVIEMSKVINAGVNVEEYCGLLQNLAIGELEGLLKSEIESISQGPNQIFDSPIEGYQDSVKTFIRTNGVPYIPGSSLKGALRSAITNYLLENISKVNYKSGRFRTILTDKRTDKSKDTDIIGEVKEGEDFMRFMQVSDIKVGATKLLNTKVFNLQGEGSQWSGGWKQSGSKTTTTFSSKGFNTIYECICPQEKAQGSITFANNAFEMIQDKLMVSKQQKQSLMDKQYGLTQWFHVVNQQTLSYLQKELDFFKTYPAERSSEIEECIRSLISCIKDSKDAYCVLKMAAGSGYHTITGGWNQYSKDYVNNGIWQDEKEMKRMGIASAHKNKHRYKSRRIVEYNGKLQLMGFVKLTAM